MAKKDEINNPRTFDVIVNPIVTEKSTIAAELGKYVFEVPIKADKKEIKSAVEELFAVNVTKVNTLNYDGKTKRFRGRVGKRKAFKKAIVTLKEGQSIDWAGGI